MLEKAKKKKKSPQPIVTGSRSEAARGQCWRERLICREIKGNFLGDYTVLYHDCGTFWCDDIVLYHDCGSRYRTAFICQNSSNCTLK